LNILPLLNYLTALLDPYALGHVARMNNMVVELSEQAGIQRGSVEMENIELATALHDIGKFGIPESVRRNYGMYMPSERLIMEQHPVIGARILMLSMNGDINPEIVRIAKYHHERWNGSGYPDGLKGDEIPKGARIVAICDAFDAMTHDRGYRHAMTEADALQEMVQQQVNGPVYDPALMRIFIELRRRNE